MASELNNLAENEWLLSITDTDTIKLERAERYAWPTALSMALTGFRDFMDLRQAPYLFRVIECNEASVILQSHRQR